MHQGPDIKTHAYENDNEPPCNQSPSTGSATIRAMATTMIGRLDEMCTGNGDEPLLHIREIWVGCEKIADCYDTMDPEQRKAVLELLKNVGELTAVTFQFADQRSGLDDGIDRQPPEGGAGG